MPLLVYKRIRSVPNSRFRSLDNIATVLQQGEKHPMLCHECEERFSFLETKFARKFLDCFLQTKKEVMTPELREKILAFYKKK